MTNCKPGDIAVVIAPGPHHGALVSVISAAPTDVMFTLPCGTTNVECGPNCWVIEMLGAPFKASLRSGRTRLARYGTAHDSRLRPLRDRPGDDETIEWAGKPNDSPADLIRYLAPRRQVEFSR